MFHTQQVEVCVSWIFRNDHCMLYLFLITILLTNNNARDYDTTIRFNTSIRQHIGGNIINNLILWLDWDWLNYILMRFSKNFIENKHKYSMVELTMISKNWSWIDVKNTIFMYDVDLKDDEKIREVITNYIDQLNIENYLAGFCL